MKTTIKSRLPSTCKAGLLASLATLLLTACGSGSDSQQQSSLSLNLSTSTPNLQITDLVAGTSANGSITINGATNVDLRPLILGNPQYLGNVAVTNNVGQTGTFTVTPPTTQAAGAYQLVFLGTNSTDGLSVAFLVNVHPDPATAPASFHVDTAGSTTQTVSMSRVNISVPNHIPNTHLTLPDGTTQASLVNTGIKLNGSTYNSTTGKLDLSVTLNPVEFNNHLVTIPDGSGHLGVPLLFIESLQGSYPDNGFAPQPYTEIIYLTPS
jgi:hypothetical protein